MLLYSCKVLLHDAFRSEVEKRDCTAAEIMILRALHGDDKVIAVKQTGATKRGNESERARLWQIYVGGAEDSNLGGNQAARATVLKSLFGPQHTPLPDELPATDKFMDENAAPKRSKLTLKAGAAEDVANQALT